jgi:hypothetical protein
MDIHAIIGGHKNFVFIGESGSGKSEIALNFALWLQKLNDKEVRFFDMDMTKPLFRSRDKEKELAAEGIRVIFKTQFMDAPTLVGGVIPALKDSGVYSVLDVGGDYIGARSIGGFAGLLNRDGVMVFYVLNAFRPWCDSIEHIDGTLGNILGVSRILLNRFHMINNTNCGPDTKAEDFLEGSARLVNILEPYAKICFSTVREDLYAHVRERDHPVFPLRLFLAEPWYA